MTITSYHPPAALRLARAVIITQSAFAALGAVVALAFAVSAHRDDVAARRAGNPNMYDGLGTGIGLFFAILFGVLLLVLIVPAIGLCRNRSWALIATAVVEGALVLLSAAAGSTVSMLLLVPSAIALVAILQPATRRWCRNNALA